MVGQIKLVLGVLTASVEAGERSAALQAVAQFAVLFDEFLHRNNQYIFAHEAASLNNCLKEMLAAVESNDFHGLTGLIRSTFLNFLDEWDFENKPLH